MTVMPAPARQGDDGSVENMAEGGGHGGRMATLFSAIALVFSSISFYISALQQADLSIFVPPVLQYGRDGGGDVDVFAVPITIANNGANTGTVLAMELKVTNRAENADPKSKTFYSAFLGEHPRDGDKANRSFAPISVPGRATYSETIRFYPQGNPLPKIVGDAGEYEFTLMLTVAEPPEPSLIDRVVKMHAPEPLTFTRTLPYLSEQHLAFRRGTISMHAKDWKPTAGNSK